MNTQPFSQTGDVFVYKLSSWRVKPHCSHFEEYYSCDKANFQFYGTYPAGVILKNHQLMTNIQTKQT